MRDDYLGVQVGVPDILRRMLPGTEGFLLARQYTLRVPLSAASDAHDIVQLTAALFHRPVEAPVETDGHVLLSYRVAGFVNNY